MLEKLTLGHKNNNPFSSKEKGRDEFNLIQNNKYIFDNNRIELIEPDKKHSHNSPR